MGTDPWGLREHTQVEDVAPPTRIEPQGRVAGGAVLRFELLDVFVETGLVGDVAAGELQDAFAAEGVLEGLLAHGALAPDEGPFPAGPRPLQLQHARHRTAGSPIEGGLHAVTVGGRRPRRAGGGGAFEQRDMAFGVLGGGAAEREGGEVRDLAAEAGSREAALRGLARWEGGSGSSMGDGKAGSIWTMATDVSVS